MRFAITLFCDMPAYVLKQYPGTVLEKDIDSVWQADADIDVLLNMMRSEGPKPPGYKWKYHGKKFSYIWQINLKVERRQIRILYVSIGLYIVILHIHKKSSPQEQTAGYATAVRRKKAMDQLMTQKGTGPSGLYPVN